MRNQLEDSDPVHIYVGKLGWILLCHRIKKYLDLVSMRLLIHRVLKNFHSGERIKKFADLCAGFTRYIWMEAVSGKKKLWIQKYPDMCGWGLSCSKLYHQLEVGIFCMLPQTVAN